MSVIIHSQPPPPITTPHQYKSIFFALKGEFSHFITFPSQFCPGTKSPSKVPMSAGGWKPQSGVSGSGMCRWKTRDLVEEPWIFLVEIDAALFEHIFWNDMTRSKLTCNYKAISCWRMCLARIWFNIIWTLPPQNERTASAVGVLASHDKTIYHPNLCQKSTTPGRNSLPKQGATGVHLILFHVFESHTTS